MSGDQEVPSVTTSAEGTGAFTLTDAGLRFSVTYDDLSTAFAGGHIHQGQLGSIGPVVRDLGAGFSGPSATGTWTPADAQPLSTASIRDLVTGNLYANVHSVDFPDGEIRGQLGDYAVTGIGSEPITGIVPVLLPASPNPFRAATTVRHELPERTAVRLRLLDLQGRVVTTLVEGVEEGPQEVEVGGEQLPPWVYFLHLEAGRQAVFRKLIRTR